MMNWLIAAAVMAGKARPINFQNTAVSDFRVNPTPGAATITFTSGGVVNEVGNIGGASPAFTWLLAGNAADFDIYLSVTGDTGLMSGSALNTWLNLGTSRGWSITNDTPDLKSVSGTYSIGYTGTGVAIGSANFSMSATSEV